MNKQLQEAYDPNAFRKSGHELVDLLADYLTQALSGNKNLATYPSQQPEDAFQFWSAYQLENQNPIPLFEEVLKQSIHLHHPQYMGHQISVPLPVTGLAGFFSSVLNSGMGVYEMGVAGTAIEKVLAKLFAQKIGFGSNADGFFTSGGTLANLTALLAARGSKTSVWKEGMLGQQFAVMVCCESHYCVERALRIMGWGEAGIVSIPSDKQFRMRTDLLEDAFEKAKQEGKTVLGVVGNACSTSTGSYDNLEAIGVFCKKHNLWFHVDGAHGGAAIFSDKYKYLLKGIEAADSVVIDCHKTMMVPTLSTLLLFKNEKKAYQTFSQKAAYLWEKAGEMEWYNLAKRTFECTKSLMGFKLYTILQIHGEAIFGIYIDTIYDLAKQCAQTLKDHAQFELAIEPDANILCFRFRATNLNEEKTNQLNANIRKTLIEKEAFYIVQTSLDGKVYLRTTLMNPFTTVEVFTDLLEEVSSIANVVLNKTA